jgi:hypothetical protein
MTASTIHVPADLSTDDLRRLVQLVSDANEAAELKDDQVQRIETTLDLALMECERTL